MNANKRCSRSASLASPRVKERKLQHASMTCRVIFKQQREELVQMQRSGEIQRLQERCRSVTLCQERSGLWSFSCIHTQLLWKKPC